MERFVPAVGAAKLELNWSREGAARSFGLRNVPFPTVPMLEVLVLLARVSRDGAARRDVVRGRGSLDVCVCWGSLEGRGIPRGMPLPLAVDFVVDGLGRF